MPFDFWIEFVGCFRFSGPLLGSAYKVVLYWVVWCLCYVVWVICWLVF